jgi:hypothetical protein
MSQTLLYKLDNLIEGTVVKRPSRHIKTPYVADVKINEDVLNEELNEEVLAHTPSLGCCGLADVSATVLMSKSTNATKCSHTIYLSVVKDQIIGIHPKLAETLVENALKMGLLTRLQNVSSLYELTKEEYPCLTESLFLTGRHSVLVDKIEKTDITTNKFLKRRLCNKYLLPCFANKKAKVYDKNGLFKIWSFCLKTNDINKQFGIYANGLLVETTSKKYINNIKLNLMK